MNDPSRKASKVIHSNLVRCHRFRIEAPKRSGETIYVNKKFAIHYLDVYKEAKCALKTR